MAEYILANGESGPIEPLFGSYFSASELQGLVEGDFAIIGLLDKGVIVINDEYYQIGVEKNEQASALAKGFIPKETWIAGPALYIPCTDSQKEIEETSTSCQLRHIPHAQLHAASLHINLEDAHLHDLTHSNNG